MYEETMIKTLYRLLITYGDAGRLYARALKVMTDRMTNDENNSNIHGNSLTAIARVTLEMMTVYQCYKNVRVTDTPLLLLAGPQLINSL